MKESSREEGKEGREDGGQQRGHGRQIFPFSLPASLHSSFIGGQDGNLLLTLV